LRKSVRNICCSFHALDKAGRPFGYDVAWVFQWLREML
jgi:hypothetical protein